MRTRMNGCGSVIAASLLIVLGGFGCASTTVTDQNRVVYEKLPRPGQILVYDFAATPADLPPGSAMTSSFVVDTAPQTAEQIALGRQLGSQIATELVAQINGMGMVARHATNTTRPQVNDIVFRGYLVSIEAGSAGKRVAIGFGSGTAELRTAVEAFQMTPQGLRKLGSGTVESGGSKSPGMAVGAAAFIATANPAGLIVSGGMKAYGESSGKSTVEGRAKETAKEIGNVLKKRFQEQGWIG